MRSEMVAACGQDHAIDRRGAACLLMQDSLLQIEYVLNRGAINVPGLLIREVMREIRTDYD